MKIFNTNIVYIVYIKPLTLISFGKVWDWVSYLKSKLPIWVKHIKWEQSVCAFCISESHTKPNNFSKN